MKDRYWLRTWAGPLTIGSFGVVAATGILMFFHANTGLMKLAHEWLSWLLVLGVIAHVVLNKESFLGYFRKPSSVTIMSVFLVLAVLTLVPLGGVRGRPPFMEAFRALEMSSLSVVSDVAQKSPESLMEELRAKGIRVRDRQQSLREIAAENSLNGMEVLRVVFNNSEMPAKKSVP